MNVQNVSEALRNVYEQTSSGAKEKCRVTKKPLKYGQADSVHSRAAIIAGLAETAG